MWANSHTKQSAEKNVREAQKESYCCPIEHSTEAESLDLQRSNSTETSAQQHLAPPLRAVAGWRKRLEVACGRRWTAVDLALGGLPRPALEKLRLLLLLVGVTGIVVGACACVFVGPVVCLNVTLFPYFCH